MWKFRLLIMGLIAMLTPCFVGVVLKFSGKSYLIVFATNFW